jgi:hypothetical protein
MRVHPVGKPLAGIAPRDAVRVEQQDVGRCALACAAIDPRGETVIGLQPEELNVRKRPLELVSRVAPGGVIDDADLYGRIRGSE